MKTMKRHITLAAFTLALGLLSYTVRAAQAPTIVTTQVDRVIVPYNVVTSTEICFEGKRQTSKADPYGGNWWWREWGWYAYPGPYWWSTAYVWERDPVQPIDRVCIQVGELQRLVRTRSY